MEQHLVNFRKNATSKKNEGLKTFFRHKGHRPGENIHELGQKVRMRGVVELLDVQGIVLMH